VCFFLPVISLLAAPVLSPAPGHPRRCRGVTSLRVLPSLQRRQMIWSAGGGPRHIQCRAAAAAARGKHSSCADVLPQLRSAARGPATRLSLARPRGPVAWSAHLPRIELRGARLEALIAPRLKLVSLERPVHSLDQATRLMSVKLLPPTSRMWQRADRKGASCNCRRRGPVAGVRVILRAAQRLR